MQHRHGERGQILIITGVSMVVLIAIGAIVADLGFSWLLHRQEQNAADPASLAAARYISGTGVTDAVLMKQEACFYVQQNGFFVGDAGCAAAYLNGNLHVASPPTSTYSGNFRGRFGYVEVLITATHPSFFGQFFGRPTATVRTAAVVAHTEGNANSSSLVALGNSCQGTSDNGASDVSGGGTLYIHPANAGVTEGGFVNINAPCGQIGNPNSCDGTGGSGAALALSGYLETTSRVFLVGGCKTSGTGSGLTCLDVNPCLDEQQVPMGDPLADVPEPFPFLEGSLPVPLCPDPAEINAPNDPDPCTLSDTGANAPCPTGTCTMLPGIYYSGWDVKGNVAIVMKPGMYVFAGGGLKVTAGASITSVTDVDGLGNLIDARVTIFSTDGPMCPTSPGTTCQGEIKFTSNGPQRLKATNDVSCQQVSPQICPWSGILLWQDGSIKRTPGDLTITGKGDLVLSGTIYAPNSKVSIAGGTNGSGCSIPAPGETQTCLAVQIIAMSWSISGGGTVDMPYDPNELFHVTQIGLVH